MGNFSDVIIGNPPYFSISSDNRLRIIANEYKTYIQTGDIYALFYELGLKILKQQGFQSFIISNKWMRTNYGQTLRKFILENSNPMLLVDFGQNLIFNKTIVHTNIIFSQKNIFQNNLDAYRFEDNSFFAQVKNIKKFVDIHKIKNVCFNQNTWNIISSETLLLKQKIELKHKPLKDWNIKINYGLKTGLNEAFIIDGITKDEILAHEPESYELIKPILRGRDTRKYFCEFKNQWIINIPKGYTIKSQTTHNVVKEPTPRYGFVEIEEAWEWFSDNHPLLAKHLIHFRDKAIKRDDKGDYWWELRACAYIAEFEKPKIIFSEIVSEPQFYYDEKAYYPEATVFFISGEDLKFLTAILNSKAATFFFKSFYMGGELVGKIRYKKAFIEQLPIPIPSLELKNEILKSVDKIIETKLLGKQTLKIEKQIDQMVYKLYDLTDEEINVVENHFNTTKE